MEQKQSKVIIRRCGCCQKFFSYSTEENKWRSVCDDCRRINNTQMTSWKNDIDVSKMQEKKHVPNDIKKACALAKYYGMTYGDIVAKYDYETRAKLYKDLQLARTLSKRVRKTKGVWADPENGGGEQEWQSPECQGHHIRR